jgi:regulator of microtubule dynamics protein 3
LSEFLSSKEKIGNSYKIKEHALKAKELRPEDGSIDHLLGKWSYSMANISWLERTAASALFATPPTATYLH